MTGRARVAIDAARLHRVLACDPALVILDVRWTLGDTHGRDHHRSCHIPGAVYVDLETQLAGPPGSNRGRHPLPEPAALEEAARSWGIGATSHVVAYDDVSNLSAARAWWLLRWAGLRDVQLLDGGLAAWKRAGYDTESGTVTPERGDATLAPGTLPVLSAEESAGLARTGLLLDARACARFRGELEPIDPRLRAPIFARTVRSRTLACSRGGLPPSAPTAPPRSASTAARASRQRTRSQRWRLPGSTPRSTPVRGRNG
jgi:thiosulfate/3-mercaptopyruvate sulfurtransferase